MYNDIKNNLKSLKHDLVSPDKKWVKNNRDLLLSQISNTVEKKEKFSTTNIWSGLSVFIPRSFVYGVVRPLAIFLLVFAITSSGWVVTVDASSNALPGDWLYPAKRVAEKTKITAATLTGSKKSETKYRVESAKKRAEEVSKIIKTEDPIKKSKVNETITDLKKEIDAVNKNLEEIKADSKQINSAEVAKQIQKETEVIKIALKEAQTNLLSSENNEDKILSKELSNTKEIIQGIEEKAVEVVVDKHLSGDQTVTSQDVTDVITGALERAVSEIADSKRNVEEAGRVIEEAKINKETIINDADEISTTNATSSSSSSSSDSEVISTSSQVAISSSSNQNTITLNTQISDKQINQEVLKKITEVKETTKQASEKTQSASSMIEEKINEAKSMLSSGNLEGVMDKIKEVNQSVKEVGDISTQAVASVKNVLPQTKPAEPSLTTQTQTKEDLTKKTTEQTNTASTTKTEGEGQTSIKQTN